MAAMSNGKIPEEKIDGHGAAVNEQRATSFHAWTEGVTDLIAGSSTGFGMYLSQSFLCCKDGRLPSSTALFPIPIPCLELWSSRPKALGRERRERRAVQKALHLIVMALNYLYLASPMSSLSGLRRCPTYEHGLVYLRLQALIKAGGPTGLFSSLGCGRKSHQLSARFEELLRSLQSLGLGAGSRYSSAVDARVPLVNDRDELVPYRPLDHTRLKISGRGSWDARPFLSDLLYMPFCEPRINEYAIVPPSEVLPDFSGVSAEEVLGMCKVWDAKGLLRLFPWELGPMKSAGCTKVFGNFKGPDADRQIGDRRAQNFIEGKLPGPSRHLPSGVSLLQLAPKRYEEKLIGSITDRKDFEEKVCPS